MAGSHFKVVLAGACQNYRNDSIMRATDVRKLVRNGQLASSFEE